jgi:hypothetical protein
MRDIVFILLLTALKARVAPEGGNSLSEKIVTRYRLSERSIRAPLEKYLRQT